MEAFNRLFEAALRGGKRGWNPKDPIGLDPQTRLDLYKKGFYSGPFGMVNSGIVDPAISLGDAAARSGNALLHGGAALAGQASEEIGLSSPGMGKRLERDLLGISHMVTGGAGRLGGAASLGKASGQNASNTAQTWSRNPQWFNELTTSKQFVKGADGSIDLGRIGPEVAEASEGRFPQAPIRMQNGLSGPDGYGARHISSDKHQRAQGLGYVDGLGLIDDVVKNHDVVVEQVNGRLMLVKKDGQSRYVIAEYRDGGWRRLLGGEQGYYGVTTGFPDTSGAVKKPKRSELNKSLRYGGKKLWDEDESEP